jgi:hypothetical protein
VPLSQPAAIDKTRRGVVSRRVKFFSVHERSTGPPQRKPGGATNANFPLTDLFLNSRFARVRIRADTFRTNRSRMRAGIRPRHRRFPLLRKLFRAPCPDRAQPASGHFADTRRAENNRSQIEYFPKRAFCRPARKKPPEARKTSGGFFRRCKPVTTEPALPRPILSSGAKSLGEYVEKLKISPCENLSFLRLILTLHSENFFQAPLPDVRGPAGGEVY